MGELISREAAIDALSKAGLINYAATGDGNGMIHAVNVIKALPSADVPDTNVGDMISRKAAIEVLNKLARDNFTLNDAFAFYLGALHDAADEIKALPGAQPEIIRCKDCKDFRRWIDTDTTFCDLTDGIVCEDDFCSRAERRTDG